MKMLDSKNSNSTPPGHQYQTVRESSIPRENQSTYTRKPSMDATVPEIDIDDDCHFSEKSIVGVPTNFLGFFMKR